MTDKEFAQNLMQAYIYCKAATEHLSILEAYKSRISSDAKELISFTLPRLNNFTNRIDKVFIKSKRIDESHMNQINEAMFELMEQMDVKMKEIL